MEHAASRAAAELGVGPEVVRFLEPEGYLVTRFVEGREIRCGRCGLRPASSRPPSRYAASTTGLRFPAVSTSFRVVETYRETGERHGVEIPNDYAWAKEQADEIERARAGADLSPVTTTS